MSIQSGKQYDDPFALGGGMSLAPPKDPNAQDVVIMGKKGGGGATSSAADPFAKDTLTSLKDDPLAMINSLLEYFKAGGSPTEYPDSTSPLLTPDDVILDSLRKLHDKIKEETKEAFKEELSADQSGGSEPALKRAKTGLKGNGFDDNPTLQGKSSTENPNSQNAPASLDSPKTSAIDSSQATTGSVAISSVASDTQSKSVDSAAAAEATEKTKGGNSLFNKGFAGSLISALNILMVALLTTKMAKASTILQLNSNIWDSLKSNLEAIDVKATADVELCDVKIKAKQAEIIMTYVAASVKAIVTVGAGYAGATGGGAAVMRGMEANNAVDSAEIIFQQSMVEKTEKETIKNIKVAADVEKERNLNNSLKEALGKVADLLTSGQNATSKSIDDVIDSFYAILKQMTAAWKK